MREITKRLKDVCLSERKEKIVDASLKREMMFTVLISQSEADAIHILPIFRKEKDEINKKKNSLKKKKSET